MTPSGRISSGRVVSSGGNLISGTPSLEGLQWLGREISFYLILELNTWIGIQKMIRIRVPPCLLKTWNHSIALYLVFRCCGWIGGGVKLSGSRVCFGIEDVLFEEELVDELFQVL